MCCKCDGVMRYDDVKKIMLYKKGCDWFPVPISGTPTGIGQGGIDDWNGETPLPETDGVPSDFPLYTTMDSMKCAKATALVNQIWDLLTVYEALESGANLTNVAELMWGILGVSGDLWVLNAISTAFFHASGEVYADIADELENIYVDDGLKNDLICALVDQMEAPKRIGSFELFGDPVLLNVLTAADIKAAVDTFKAAVPDATYAKKWVGLFPVASWQEIVTPKIPATECACEDYAPLDPDATPEGFGRVTVTFGQAFNLNMFPDGAATPQAFIDKTEEAGEMLSDTSIGSTSLASLSGNQGIAAMFDAGAGVVITKVKFVITWTQGSNNPFDSGMAKSNGLSENFTLMFETQVGSAALNPNPSDLLEFDLSPAFTRYAWYNAAAFGTDAGDDGVLTLSDIKFNLQKADGSWSRADVPLGALFQL